LFEKKTKEGRDIMNILTVTVGYAIFDAKGQLNSFLAYLTFTGCLYFEM